MEVAEKQRESEFSYPAGRLAKLPGFGPLADRHDAPAEGLGQTRPPLMTRPANLPLVRADSAHPGGPLTVC